MMDGGVGRIPTAPQADKTNPPIVSLESAKTEDHWR